jgi:hypothetical protein
MAVPCHQHVMSVWQCIGQYTRMTSDSQWCWLCGGNLLTMTSQPLHSAQVGKYTLTDQNKQSLVPCYLRITRYSNRLFMVSNSSCWCMYLKTDHILMSFISTETIYSVEKMYISLHLGRDGNAISCCGVTPHHPECFPVQVSAADPYYHQFNLSCMEFVRSAPAPTCSLGEFKETQNLYLHQTDNVRQTLWMILWKCLVFK